MRLVKPLPFAEARNLVLDTVSRLRRLPRTETVFLENAAGRVLAQDVVADRDYPPLPRSVRDGYAVCAADLPGSVEIVGEVRAGEQFGGEVRRGQAVEIMTGAAVPAGADAVLMLEHTERAASRISSSREVRSGEFIVPRAAECERGAIAVRSGTRIDFGNLAALATVGAASVAVFAQPSVSIIATGDELVSVRDKPADHQIRNSNGQTLATQVRRAGGAPCVLAVAPDSVAATRKLVQQGLRSDLLLLSGGVSAGKYDFVETVLADLGATFYFDRVLIQPGQPLVFGCVKETFFFGLPGNPASTMVTFELFARAALDLLGGCRETGLPLLQARLASDFRHKPGLTRFLPARLQPDGGSVEPVPWQGSGDVFALARGNAFLVAREDRDFYAAGDLIEVIPR
jgi:molybdopterin molybdotransferase